MTKQTRIIHGDRSLQAVLKLIAELDLDKPWQVTVQKYVKKRSLNQNALMWMWIDGVVKHVVEHTGHDSDEIHDFLKKKFLPPKRVTVNEETTNYYSTKNLTTVEMTEYMNKIYAWAVTDLGLNLPVPEELGRAA